MKLVCDLLRNLTLDCENIIHVPIVLLCPNVGVSARINQLSVHAHFAAGPLNTAFENMRHAKRVPNLTSVPHATVRHDARAANDLQVSDFRQLGQNVVLNTIGKERVLFVLA